MSLEPGTSLAGFGVGLNPVVAKVLRVATPAKLPPWQKSGLTPAEELAQLQSAIEAVRANFNLLSSTSAKPTGEIFEALSSLLDDEALLQATQVHLDEGWSAAAAYGKAVDEFTDLLSGDAELESRVTDLQDLSRRVQAKLAGISVTLDLPASGRFVIVGDDFSPADTAQFTPAVVAVITTKGGPTSHTAIICRSRSIAALVGCSDADKLVDGDEVLVDPLGNRAVVGGSLAEATTGLQFTETGAEPIIAVRSNIGSVADAVKAAGTRASGVGLLRTELLYLSATSVPSIEEQVQAYSEIFRAAPAGPILVRTLDEGGDKPLAFLRSPAEEDLSTRSSGYHLLKQHPELIRDQLAAIELARLATGREVWVMAPMIARVAEAAEFASVARSVGNFRVGIMIETTSIASAMDDLAGVVDFVSVGTNDLSQNLFAADRTNSDQAALLDHWQPKLIEVLGEIAKSAAASGIPVGVCGESASDPAFAVVLAGLGFNSVSASPSQVNAVSSALAAVTVAQARSIAESVLRADSPEDAKNLATQALKAL